MKHSLEETLLAAIRTIPDYPKPGILFRDITTLLGNARAFRRAIDELVHPYAGQKIDKIAGIEARGFILGGAIAHQLSAGFIPIRKKGKLPHETVRVAYSLEYGLDEMEMHKDALTAGRKGDPGRRFDRDGRDSRRRDKTIEADGRRYRRRLLRDRPAGSGRPQEAGSVGRGCQNADWV